MLKWRWGGMAWNYRRWQRKLWCANCGQLKARRNSRKRKGQAFEAGEHCLDLLWCESGHVLGKRWLWSQSISRRGTLCGRGC